MNADLVVNLRMPGDAPLETVRELLARVKMQVASLGTRGASGAGVDASAEVLARPATPRGPVASVVGAILAGGVEKISVEVKE